MQTDQSVLTLNLTFKFYVRHVPTDLGEDDVDPCVLIGRGRELL
jgi:hypothetical protein